MTHSRLQCPREHIPKLNYADAEVGWVSGEEDAGGGKKAQFLVCQQLSRSETRGDSSLLFEGCISSHARRMAWWESRVPVSISMRVWIMSMKVGILSVYGSRICSRSYCWF